LFFKGKTNTAFLGGGLIIFNNVEAALKAENLLKKQGYERKLVAPPPQLRRGCDLALEINLTEKPAIERLLLKNEAHFVEVLPLQGAGKLLNIVKTTDFGNAVMVKAANMKLTFDKKSGVILNISGGGCPDIPYLHISMVNKKLTEVASPKEKGHTLCALMLDVAYREALRLWQREGA